MRSWILAARQSFWFLPAVFGVAAVLLAQGLVLADRLFAGPIAGLPFLGELSPDGGRSILTTIGTSMLTVAGTSFSITISVLATTSSTYGPRLVRNFMADRANQLVLAVFTSTFVYCLIVLRSIRTQVSDRAAFVPTLAVHLAVLGAVIDSAVLVFFIHHIATSVQITTLQKRVQTDLVRAVDHSHPADPRPGWVGPVALSGERTSPVRSAKEGYVQEVDLDQLLHAATDAGLLLEVVAMPGDHVLEGDPLVVVRAGGEVTEPLARSVRGAYVLGDERTPSQDLRFALQQLVEVAVRGLASGSNDPYTTLSALDLSKAALVPLVRRGEAPGGRLDERGAVRLAFRWPTTAELLGGVFGSLRQYGIAHTSVVRATVALALRLAEETRDESLRGLIADQVRQLVLAFERSHPGSPDCDVVAADGRDALVRLAAV